MWMEHLWSYEFWPKRLSRLMVPTLWGLCSVNWCCKEQQRGVVWQAWSQGAWLKLLTLVMVIGAKAFSILMMGVVSSPCWWVRGSSEYKTDLQTNDRMAWRSGKWCRTLALPYIVIHDNEGIHQGSVVKLLFQFKCLLLRNPNNRHFMTSSQYCSLQLQKLRSCPVCSCSLTLLDRLGRQLLKPWPQTFYCRSLVGYGLDSC